MTSEIKQKNIELLFDTLKVILTNQNLEDLSIVKKTKSANKPYSYNEVEIIEEDRKQKLSSPCDNSFNKFHFFFNQKTY